MKTTKEDFRKFKKYFNFYLKKLGVTGWTIHFLHEDAKQKSYATVYFTLEDRTITVYLSDKIPDDTVAGLDIKRIAKHEAIHGLLGRFSELAYKRFTTKDEIYEAEEELVIRIEKLID